MLMLWVTKVFHTGPPRVGRLSKNIVLPRSIPLPVFGAVPLGALLGLAVAAPLIPLLGRFMPTARIVAFAMMLGGTAGVLLVTFQPWRGEHIHRVAAVRASAFASAKVLVCPGSGMPTAHSDDVGTLVCCECGSVFGSSELFAPQHQWRRRVYVGMKPIPPPTTGEVWVVSGSVPLRPPRGPFDP